MPASTSETAASLLSSSFDSIFSGRMVAFIGCSLFRVERARMSPARRSHDAISPAEFDHIGANLRRWAGLSRKCRQLLPIRRLPAALEAGGEAAVRCTLRHLA